MCAFRCVRVVLGLSVACDRYAMVLNKVVCGPFCSLFYLGISIFAVVMLLTLATLIKNEYP